MGDNHPPPALVGGAFYCGPANRAITHLLRFCFVFFVFFVVQSFLLCDTSRQSLADHP
jgi:hypothetical protein